MDMEELTDPYCTLEDVWRETRNHKPEHTQKYIRCINEASRFVEDHCRRDFLYHVFDQGSGDYYSVPRNCVFEEKVFLPFPIIEITGLWVHGSRDTPSATSKWEEGSYYIEPNPVKGSCKIVAENGNKIGEYPFSGCLSLQGRFGYAKTDEQVVSPDLPASIRKATALIAATMSMERRLEQTNLEGNRIELVELVLPPEVFKYLNRYRNASFML